MNILQVAQYLEEHKDYLFPNDHYTEAEIENAMLSASYACEMRLSTVKYRKPSTVQIIAVFPGSLGVDRFYLGDVVKGIVKYFTFGGLGFWWIADIISAQKRCRNSNSKKLMEFIESFPKDNVSNQRTFLDFDSDFSCNDINDSQNHTTENAFEQKREDVLESHKKIDKKQIASIVKTASSIGRELKSGLKDIQNSFDVK